jgi:transcriptional regulator with XRE-family HTH domain
MASRTQAALGKVHGALLDDWARLGKLIVERRCQIGYSTRDQFARHSKLSARLLADIETGKRDSYEYATIGKLERALLWRSESVKEVLQGGQPVLLTPDEGGQPVGSINRNLALNLRRLRAQYGWSVATMAGICAARGRPELTESSLGSIEQWQTGQDDVRQSREMTAEELFFFADLFVVSIETLAGKPPCETCQGQPPAGFTCNACGESMPGSADA